MVDLNLILGQQWGLEKVVWVRRIENAQHMLEILKLLLLLDALASLRAMMESD